MKIHIPGNFSNLLSNSILIFLVLVSFRIEAQLAQDPVKIAIIGLTHTHVHWILGREDIGDIEIVGIVEPNFELAKRYATQHGFALDLVFKDIESLLAVKKPEAVTAFGSIYEHLEVVRACAPRGIHVMVEKPLAVNMEHAVEMKSLAEKHGIHLLTNYETTWYPTTHMAYQLLHEGKIGPMRKVIVRDGHKGPKKLGINKEFLDWLLDPIQNGGGAITDFGCYGANLLTWLRNGEKPISVTAITQQLQKENNPIVDDEATIIVTYPDAQGIIQASWNWPIGRKDMEIYGLTGAIFADNRTDLRIRIAVGYDGYNEKMMTLDGENVTFQDPFAMLAAVVRNRITLDKNDLSGLHNNITVVEILDAARQSAKAGETVILKD